MAKEKAFEFLEHTADAYIAAYGTNIAEAFENAALAMFDVMTEIEKVNAEVENCVEVDGIDEYALLYSWLEDLLVKFDTTRILYCRFKVLKVEETSEGLKLRARIWGEKFDPEKHPQKVGVKAITYHRMEVIRKQNRVVLRFILDI